MWERRRLAHLLETAVTKPKVRVYGFKEFELFVVIRVAVWRKELDIRQVQFPDSAYRLAAKSEPPRQGRSRTLVVTAAGEKEFVQVVLPDNR
jgi:hypothetical protein